MLRLLSAAASDRLGEVVGEEFSRTVVKGLRKTKELWGNLKVMAGRSTLET